jgi:hypothetical protein
MLGTLASGVAAFAPADPALPVSLRCALPASDASIAGRDTARAHAAKANALTHALTRLTLAAIMITTRVKDLSNPQLNNEWPATLVSVCTRR